MAEPPHKYTEENPMPCKDCGGKCTKLDMQMPDGRVITGSVCTKCGTSHNAHGAN